MITAKNYAAKVQQSVNCLITQRNATEEPDWSELHAIKNAISNAVHFLIPDGGRIIGLDGLIGTRLELPFPVITIESSISGWGLLTLAIDRGEQIEVFGFSKEEHSGVMPEFLPITRKMMVNKDYRKVENMPVADDEIIFRGLISPEDDERLTGLQGYTSIVNCEFILEELLSALSCRNVSIANHQEAFPKNASRIKAGKLPLFEIKMLVINTQHGTSGKTGNGGGSHASPRQHLRRGHIRRHPTAGNIWVNNCVVGDPAKGIIDKQYRVKK